MTVNPSGYHRAMMNMARYDVKLTSGSHELLFWEDRFDKALDQTVDRFSYGNFYLQVADVVGAWG